jgi:diguanylate cyclase
MIDSAVVEEAADLTRLTLPLMAQHGIPTTPKNYAVWYRYVEGADERLEKAIDGIVQRGEPFSEEANEMLYRQYCAERDETALLDLRENLRNILVSLLGNLVDVSEQSDEYEALVSSSLEKLSNQPSAQEIRMIVDEIIEKTRDLGKSGKTMRNRLTEAAEELEKLKQQFERAKTEALVDFLTGVANRKAFDEKLMAAVRDSSTNGGLLSLLMIDIDHFKQFNDKYGHVVGDEVLKFTTARIKEMIRGTDFVARYGGEEFSVLLPETTLENAARVAENIREVFSKGKLKKSGSSTYLGQLTVSIGVGQYHSNETAKEFVQRTDQALYFAKENGRNRVATESELPQTVGENMKAAGT